MEESKIETFQEAAASLARDVGNAEAGGLRLVVTPTASARLVVDYVALLEQDSRAQRTGKELTRYDPVISGDSPYMEAWKDGDYVRSDDVQELLAAPVAATEQARLTAEQMTDLFHVIARKNGIETISVNGNAEDDNKLVMTLAELFHVLAGRMTGSVVEQVHKALTLAMDICDAVPNRAHMLPEGEPLRHLGMLVNYQEATGVHGYALIRDAKEAFEHVTASLSQPGAQVTVPDELSDKEKAALDRLDKPEWRASSNLKLRAILAVEVANCIRMGAKIENLQDELRATEGYRRGYADGAADAAGIADVQNDWRGIWDEAPVQGEGVIATDGATVIAARWFATGWAKHDHFSEEVEYLPEGWVTHWKPMPAAGSTAPLATPADAGAGLTEELAQQVLNALALAMTICDAVPTRLHKSEDSQLANIGMLVNAQDNGAHGYAVIRDAKAAFEQAATIPKGAARSWDGTTYYNIEEMYHHFEDGEALHMWLDDKGVPRADADADGKVFSLVGRVARMSTPGAPVTAEPEYLALRLKRVARAAGVPIFDKWSNAQVLECAVTILGEIARKLEAATPAPADRDAIRDQVRQALEEAAKHFEQQPFDQNKVRAITTEIRALKSMERAADAKGEQQ